QHSAPAFSYLCVRKVHRSDRLSRASASNGAAPVEASACRAGLSPLLRAVHAGSSVLFYFPDVPGTHMLVQVAGAALGDDFLNLVLHDIFVARQIIPSPQNADRDRKSTRLNSSHQIISYAVCCLKTKR